MADKSIADKSIANGSADRPVLYFLTGHWLSVAGASLVTIAACSWLFLLPRHISGKTSNPYLGILIFFAIPALFFAGLVLIPIGAFLARRRLRAGLATAPDRRVTLRRLALFFGVMTVANVIIGSEVSYRAVAHMETDQFCGQSCHVMKPQFVANQRSAHRNVECVECHVMPGAAGFFEAKMNGTRQMIEVMTGTYPKPVPAALRSNRLAPSEETCEHCHSRALEGGHRLRIISKFKDDEANTATQTVLMMNVGGGKTGGIHGSHMGPGVEILYRAADARRESIPWIEYRNSSSGVARSYTVSGASDPGGITFVMQCADCHNRPGHPFEQADEAVDSAMAAARIPADLPFAHKTGVQVLQAAYAGDQDAAKNIPTAFAAFYQQKYPVVAARRKADIDRAGRVLTELYQGNVFGDLGVKWGTYTNNLGHENGAGCFRCHDGGHSTSGPNTPAALTITQDCNSCHQALAVEETSPQILNTLGLAPGVTNP